MVRASDEQRTRIARTALRAALCVLAPSLIILPASAETEPTPSGTPTDPLPEPGTTVAPPEDSPFDTAVGGAELGVLGVPTAAEGAPPLPAVDGRTWIVADATTGDVLAAQSPHEPRPPASTIKLLTVLSASPAIEDDVDYVATDADASIEGSRVGLAPGQSYTRADIFHGLMLASGNDTAHAVGELAGGQNAVVTMMNTEAERLGAFDTNAVTPHGLDDPAQLSSAYDLALIGRQVLEDESLATLVSTTSYDFPGLDGQTFQIQNQNRLLDSYEGAIGLKTGYTTNGGHTLVAAAERDDRRLIAVVLGADGRAEEGAAALLDWAFAAGEGGEPVGSLVTPDEVADAVQAADDAADDDSGAGNPLSDGDAIGNPSTTSGNVPVVVWIGLGAAFVAGALGFVLRRRRPRTGGRYASSRRP